MTANLLQTGDILLGGAIIDSSEDGAVGKFTHLFQMLHATRKTYPIVAEHTLCNVVGLHKVAMQHRDNALHLALLQKLLKRRNRSSQLWVGRLQHIISAELLKGELIEIYGLIQTRVVARASAGAVESGIVKDNHTTILGVVNIALYALVTHTFGCCNSSNAIFGDDKFALGVLTPRASVGIHMRE